MEMKRFGAFVAQIRRENGMTQAELAQKLGVTDKAVSRWERGVGCPDINTLEPLANALGVTLPELMRGQRQMGAPQAPTQAELGEMLAAAAEIQRRNARQQRTVSILSALAAPGAAFLGWYAGGLGAAEALALGTVCALALSGAYLYAENHDRRESRRIYGFVMVLGVGLCLPTAYFLLGLDPWLIIMLLYEVLAWAVGLDSRKK